MATIYSVRHTCQQVSDRILLLSHRNDDANHQALLLVIRKLRRQLDRTEQQLKLRGLGAGAFSSIGLDEMEDDAHAT